MIICHCNSITDDDINRAIDWMRAADPEAIITPRKIYRALGKAADCGGCISLFVETMRRNENLAVPMQLRGNSRAATQEKADERRSEGHRLSQPRAQK
ncbi:Bacterioferritin-associated ferredoxin [Meinhardsimonia xiamenensis]|jgi:bacterioferritin-associated ferredoxin|uniref:Bacterioferritin-associated ferredoxin n=1 Tax=Meinhardsimonia xiamenensis TaxID=990712 RepID=A0A1G9DCI6_9RHOB|nr:(2Fe-2S)-binding protein [Meinhardsimonia xiamenensis]PRX38043.1 bacterioferritin-associated ferredoxin [Meinhardsimonia xiamenensis]SDK61579.1 Bacterioferritin-associated ferredoxin [Meinhardsimonia xiamenensis]